MGRARALTALVIGAGIGGLAAAGALWRAGLEVRLFERATELGELGAGLVVWPNGIWALRKLGLAEPIESSQLGLRRLSIRTASGRTLKSLSASELWPRLDAEWIALRRAELHAYLRQGLDGCELNVGHRLSTFTEDAGGVTAKFENGTEARGDVLIGADGLRSATRAQLVGQSEPRYAGYTDWRCVTRVDPNLRVKDMTLTHGRGAGVGLFAMAGERAFWFATRNAEEGGTDESGQMKHRLLEWFGDWHAPIGKVIESSSESDIVRTDIFDRDPIPEWGAGRVTLLGDAAHPMTPDWGQGASQALEDAVALGDAFKEQPSVVDALRDYVSRRLKRANYIVTASRQAGSMNRPDGSLGVFGRNTFYRLAPLWLQRYGIGMIVGQGPAPRVARTA